MLIDSFLFFNETELVELRIKYLNKIVDYFVIVEADITHQGKKKDWNFSSILFTVSISLSMNDNLPSSMIEMFLVNARDEPDRVVLNYKLEEEWQELGWGVIARHASRYAVVLREKGVQAGDRVILVSENRYEWILVDLAIQLLGAIHVPVHAPLTGHQIAYQVNDSAAVMAIVSGHEQASKLDNVELSDQLVLMSFDTVSTDRAYEDLPGTAENVPDEVGDAIMQERVDNPLDATTVRGTLDPDPPGLAQVVQTRRDDLAPNLDHEAGLAFIPECRRHPIDAVALGDPVEVQRHLPHIRPAWHCRDIGLGQHG